jgi:hypothetical protein
MMCTGEMGYGRELGEVCEPTGVAAGLSNIKAVFRRILIRVRTVRAIKCTGKSLH